MVVFDFIPIDSINPKVVSTTRPWQYAETREGCDNMGYMNT